MATLIPADGSQPRYIEPANGRAFTLRELQQLVGGYIEALTTTWEAYDEPLTMFLNEDGKRLQLPINRFATAIVRTSIAPTDYIVGDVVLCTRTEAGEDDEADGAEAGEEESA